MIRKMKAKDFVLEDMSIYGYEDDDNIEVEVDDESYEYDIRGELVINDVECYILGNMHHGWHVPVSSVSEVDGKIVVNEKDENFEKIKRKDDGEWYLPIDDNEIGYWGRKIYNYLKEVEVVKVRAMELGGELKSYLLQRNESAEEVEENFREQYKKANPIPKDFEDRVKYNYRLDEEVNEYMKDEIYRL